jgi:hypothetical protein
MVTDGATAELWSSFPIWALGGQAPIELMSMRAQAGLLKKQTALEQRLTGRLDWMRWRGEILTGKER